MVDNMYPDSLPPEVAVPFCIAGLAFYVISVVRERRANRKVSK